MASLKAFKAIRPIQQVVSEVAALPYDVFTSQEARVEVEDKPLSFLKIDRGEVQLNEMVSPYDEKAYKASADLLEKLRCEGVLIQEKEACLYIYELIMNGRSQSGIVGLASVDDYINGIVCTHENTRVDKEQDRIRHIDVCSAQTGPIFLAYKKEDKLQLMVETQKRNNPIYDFISEDGIVHKVWRIHESDVIEEITSRFADIEKVYIADGHHRAASAVKVAQKRREANPSFTGEEEFNHFLAVLFQEEELKILDYNRVVKDWNHLEKDELIEKIKAYFEVQEIKNKEYSKPSEKRTFGMYIDKQWYRLVAKEEIFSSDPVEGLDVAVLQRYILGDILGILDPKTDERISFVGGIRGIEEIEKQVDESNGVGFMLHPTTITELFSVADAKRLMPPKSTWFEPKLRSGIFIHEIEKQ